VRAAALALAALLAGAAPALADDAAAVGEAACRNLAAKVDAAPFGHGGVFLRSFEPLDVPNRFDHVHANTAFVYDNALAAIALVACGEAGRARLIGDALVHVAANDRHFDDGRLRNAYAAGRVGIGEARLPGWWEEAEGRWLEDGFHAGSGTGNIAWAALALVTLAEQGGPGAEGYLAAAVRLAAWTLGRQDARGPGGFTGGTQGHEPKPDVIGWKATEHNLDLYALYDRLHRRTGEARWQAAAAEARRFVDAMWQDGSRGFVTGTTDDGATLNTTLRPLDAQIWPLMAVPGQAARRDAVTALIDREFRVEERDDVGYDFNADRDGIWLEGTAQVATLLRLMGRDDRAAPLLRTLAADPAPGGGFYATTAPQLTTGLDDPLRPAERLRYYRRPHIAVSAWAALAAKRFNPFTGGGGLPE